MSTIRQHLTQHLLTGLALLLLAAGGTTYCLTRTALQRQFDDALRTKAMALLSLAEQDAGHIEMESTSQFMHEFEPGTKASFFQLWYKDGTVIKRSPSLRDADLAIQYGPLNTPIFWDLKMPDGQTVRAIGVCFQPRFADDKPVPGEPALAVLVTATSRQDLEASLSILALVLTSSALLVLGLAAVAMPRLLRRELLPLDDLANRTQLITAETLTERFPSEGLPGELQPISTRLNDLLQRLQSAFERERQFSDDLAHELRTPLAELRSLAELALKWPDARPANADQQTLAIATQMESIIGRLLAIARSTQGRIAVTLEPVDLNVMVANICQAIAPRAAGRKIHVVCRAGFPPKMQSDPVMIRATLTNLVENAVEYSPLNNTIQIDLNAQNGEFSLSVSNRAPNLTAQDIPHLFDRFWRKDEARSGGEHAGLGLSLTQAFCTSLGYRLEAQLQEDANLVMTISGPVCPKNSNQNNPNQNKK